MRVPQYGFATALVLSASMFTAPVEAAEPGPDTLPIHVISVQTMDADDQAEALTKALRQAVRAMPGWSQAEGDYSLEVLTLSLKCPEPPDAGCQSRIADQIRADRYVWGVISKGKSNNVVGELSFWVRGKGTTSFKVDYSANLTEAQDDALKKVAMDAIMKLTDGPPKGEVKVSAGGIAGQVFVDGQPLGALTGGQGTFFVPSGKHELIVKAPGYADMISEITVKPNAPTDVTVVPVAVGDKTPTNWKRIGGFIAIGAGVGFGALGVVGTAKVDGLNKDADYSAFRQRYATTSNVCDIANGTDTASKPVGGAPEFTPEEKETILTNYCEPGSTAELLQLVFYPLAAVAAGAGIFLVATSGTRSKEKPAMGLMVLPRVSQTAVKVDVGFQF
ncbi:MAG: PEGA domain-containing protein [Polyangiaceae bacterium]|nr:PEGA domain-containing protein [Polyangiaceae bacterium]